jgi:hypothetical protein
VRIRITKVPDPAEFAEFDVRMFRAGEVFDVAPYLATLLIVSGNAEPLINLSDGTEASDQMRKDRNQLS